MNDRTIRAWLTLSPVAATATLAAGQEGSSGDLSTPGMPGASEATPTQGQPAGPQGSAPPPGGLGLFLPLMLILGFFILTSMMSQRKERKKQQEMLSNLAKHDRVVTLGGLIGTIVEVKDHEVVLKVDEQVGAKIRFTRSSVQKILSKHGDPTVARDSDDTEPTGAETEPEPASLGS